MKTKRVMPSTFAALKMTQFQEMIGRFYQLFSNKEVLVSFKNTSLFKILIWVIYLDDEKQGISFSVLFMSNNDCLRFIL